MTEDEMDGWHHNGDGREFVQAPGVGDGEAWCAIQSMGLQRVGHDCTTELNCSCHPVRGTLLGQPE